MIRRVIRALISITGFVLGFTTYLSLTKEYEEDNKYIMEVIKKDNVKEYIRNNPEFCEEVEGKVREGIKNLISARNPISRREAAVPVQVEPVSKATARAKIDIAVDDDE